MLVIILFYFIDFKSSNLKDIMDNVKNIENLGQLKQNFDDEISKVIIGQEKIINEIFIALLCNGHIILEGVPGLAKTLLINSISKALDLNFSRIQFTPDLMPADITGTEIIQENKTLLPSIKGFFNSKNIGSIPIFDPRTKSLRSSS